MRLVAIVLLIGMLGWACSPAQGPSAQKAEPNLMVFPVKSYQKTDFDEPFSFEFPAYSKISKENSPAAQEGWNNIDFPEFDARLHLTYYPLNSPEHFRDLTEEARKLAMRHSIRASAINPQKIAYPQKKVYGLYYFIEGDAASSVQFFLTDSAKHYFRGALYFNQAKDYDSIKPVIQFLDKDIRHLVETFEWKSKSKP